MLTQEQFTAAKKNFDAAYTLNYAFRNAMIQDDEETRIVEGYQAEGQAYIDQFPMAVRPELERLIKTLDDGDDSEAVNHIYDLLLPYISNKEVFDNDEHEWEAVLMEDDYATFVEIMEDMN